MPNVRLTMSAPAWWTSISRLGNLLGPLYAESGFSISDSYAPPRNLVDPSPSRPIEGFGHYLTGYAPEITRGGASFGVTGLALDLTSSGGYFTITGKTVYGTTVTHFVASDNRPFSFETLVLPASFAAGLVSLTVAPLGVGGQQISLDNVDLIAATQFNGSAVGDTINGTAGNDEIHGWAGNDQLFGGSGDDILDGGKGADRLVGGGGNDIYFVDTRDDQVIEQTGGGIDTVVTGVTYVLGDQVENLHFLYGGAAWGTGNALDNRLEGNSGDNVLRGLNGNDTLIGNAGNDNLQGGWGDDILDGGAGVDLLTGGGGADRFVITGRDLASGVDIGTIADFSAAQGDKIDLSGLTAYSFIGTDQFTPYDDYGASSLGEFRYDVVSGGVRLEGDVDGDGVADWSSFVSNTSLLGASDFVLFG